VIFAARDSWMLSGLRWPFRIVMAGLVPAIHVFLHRDVKTWMPGTSPGMTSYKKRSEFVA